MPAQQTDTAASGKRKFTPRPARPAEERLPRLYRGLTDQVDEGHFANAIKTCKKILNLDPKADAAFQTLLFLHLHTDDYASALALLDRTPEKLPFERAYCLYRLHKEKEALEVLDKISPKGRKEEHLEAQIRYRLGEYQKAQELYDDLLASCPSSSAEHPDILENLSATASHLEFDTHGYHAHLQPSTSHSYSEADLESHVPSLPTGWAVGGMDQAKTSGPSKEAKKSNKTRHKLPKGVKEGQAFTEDPDRWLPIRQRASYITAMSKKRGQNLSMGTGMTQGSTTQQQAAAGSGGGKKKKGKK